MCKTVLALLLAATPLTSVAAMPVSQFLPKAEALMKKGPLAVFSGDLGLLQGEVKTSFKQLRQEQAAARNAGRKPDSCMPAKVPLSPRELMAHMHSIPPAQRGMSFKTALGTMMAKKYPCPA